MKKFQLPFFVLFLLLGRQMLHAQDAPSTAANVFAKLSEKITITGVLQPRLEASFTDSVDVQGMVVEPDPVQFNFRLRRARLRFDAVINQHFTATIRLAFQEFFNPTHQVVELAFLNYRYTDAFQIRAGQFKPGFFGEELLDDEFMRMIDRGPTDQLFKNNNLCSYQPGIMVWGELFHETRQVNYYVSMWNGNGKNYWFDNNNQKNYAARVEYFVTKDLRLAINGQISGMAPGVYSPCYGGDVDYRKTLKDGSRILLMAEYESGVEVNSYLSDTADNRVAKNYRMQGAYVDAVYQYFIDIKGLRYLEAGGKVEYTDPFNIFSTQAYNTYTLDLAAYFLPDYRAKISFNLIRTHYKQEEPGVTKSNTLGVLQFQLRF